MGGPLPLYLHPQLPQVPVLETYYSGDSVIHSTPSSRATDLAGTSRQAFSSCGSFTPAPFDRHPDLQVIVGHSRRRGGRAGTLCQGARLPRRPRQ